MYSSVTEKHYFEDLAPFPKVNAEYKAWVARYSELDESLCPFPKENPKFTEWIKNKRHNYWENAIKSCAPNYQ